MTGGRDADENLIQALIHVRRVETRVPLPRAIQRQVHRQDDATIFVGCLQGGLCHP